MSLKLIRNIIFILSLCLLSSGIAYNLGKREFEVSWRNYQPQFSVVNTTPPVTTQVDFTLFWEVWDKLAKNYIDKKALDPQKMVWGAISGMVQSLGDPYTVFLTPSQQKESKEELGGQFEGIGAQLGIKNKKIVVVAPLKDMPAEKAGIKPGDWSYKVEGKETINWTLPETVSNIRGPKGTKVNLTIVHEGEEKPVEIAVVRDSILVKSVDWEKKGRKGSSEGQGNKITNLKL